MSTAGGCAGCGWLTTHRATQGRSGAKMPGRFAGGRAGYPSTWGQGTSGRLTPDRAIAIICLMEDNLIPLADLVGVFHRSKSTLYRWAEANQIPTRRIGSTVYMHKDDVARYTSNRRRVDEELERRRQTHGRILDAETMSLVVTKLEDALAALQRAKRTGE